MWSGLESVLRETSPKEEQMGGKYRFLLPSDIAWAMGIGEQFLMEKLEDCPRCQHRQVTSRVLCPRPL